VDPEDAPDPARVALEQALAAANATLSRVAAAQAVQYTIARVAVDRAQAALDAYVPGEGSASASPAASSPSIPASLLRSPTVSLPSNPASPVRSPGGSPPVSPGSPVPPAPVAQPVTRAHDDATVITGRVADELQTGAVTDLAELGVDIADRLPQGDLRIRAEAYVNHSCLYISGPANLALGRLDNIFSNEERRAYLQTALNEITQAMIEFPGLASQLRDADLAATIDELTALDRVIAHARKRSAGGSVDGRVHKKAKTVPRSSGRKLRSRK